MDECKDTWYPFSWYCPNCGTQLIGFKNAEGMIKVECKRCLAVSVRKVMGRRHNRIDAATFCCSIGTDPEGYIQSLSAIFQIPLDLFREWNII